MLIYIDTHIIYIYTYNWFIGLVGRVFTNDPGDLVSIQGH